MEWSTGLPEGITDRTLALCAEYKRSFGKTISRETLRKYLHLWHPNFYVEDPWAENSSNACQTDKYGYFNQQISVDQNKNVRNTYQMGEYGYFPYMKVLCLPPADASPQGESSASEVSDQVECVEVESPEIENVNIFNNSNNQPNSEIENLEIENCFDNSNNELNSEIENPENLENPEIIENVNNLNNCNNSNNEFTNSNDSLESLNHLQSRENNSDKHFKYQQSGGAAENGDNKNLSINLDQADCTAPSEKAVPPEPVESASRGVGAGSTALEQSKPEVAPPEPVENAPTDISGIAEKGLFTANPTAFGSTDSGVSPEIEELRQATRLRLKALSDAQKAVRTYCVITGRLLLGQERSRLEQIAKYQFYLDSGCSVLVAEAEAWADGNPGCLPFSLESAFTERASE
ncbi:MAG: hypothetical protein HC874_09690 [Richelia sp. SL_2_1]|nr:hypothetical protein [Richelia sp. SM2_1_7]NJN12523.1 hypothetical protein [Richelia sp. RM1_1_1]NJO27774.1 hypothetical protein [Richelia sp. SL_2_1]